MSLPTTLVWHDANTEFPTIEDDMSECILLNTGKNTFVIAFCFINNLGNHVWIEFEESYTIKPEFCLFWSYLK